MKWTAYIDDDGAIIVRGRSEHLDGQDGRPLGEGPLERIGPGDELFGQPFAYWRAHAEQGPRKAWLPVRWAEDRYAFMQSVDACLEREDVSVFHTLS